MTSITMDAAPTTTSRTARLSTILLAAAIFTTGLAGLVDEYVLSTVSTYILGNSIEQFSVTIGLMMFMMGVGAVIQRRFSDEHLLDTFLRSQLALALIGGFAPLITYWAFGVMEDHFALVHYGLASAVGILIGFELPLVLRLNARFSVGLRENLSWIFLLDYVGAFAGALLWTKVLLKKMPLFQISFVVTGMNLALAVLVYTWFVHAGYARRSRSTQIAIPIVAALMIAGWYYTPRISIALEQRLYEDKIVFSETTPYQRIVVTHDASLEDTRLYLNGNLQFSSYDEARYHEPLVHPAMNLAASRARVLILGGGDGLALREVLKYPDVRSVTLVDLDEEMTRIAANDPVFRRLNRDAFRDARVQTLSAPGVTPAGNRPIFVATDEVTKTGRPITEQVADVRVLNIDADAFLNGLRDRWDVVLVDFPDPNAVELAKLYSREFYRKLQNVIAPGGMIAIQSTSTYHAKDTYLTIGKTLASAGYQTLPYHVNVPSFGDWGWYLAWTDGATPGSVRARLGARAAYPVATDYLTPQLMQAACVFGKGELESDRATVSTLMEPTILQHYIDDAWKVD